MITIPTIAQLYESIISDLESEFDATISEEGKSALRGFAATQAGKIKQFYLAIASLQKNVFPDTSDEETLIRFGLVKLNRQPFSAIAGQYTVTVTGTAGGVIPAQTIFKSDDDSLNPGILYVLDAAYTMLTSSDSITLRSLTLGTESELEIGDTLTSTSPIPLVNSTATVTLEVVQPLAAETIETYREAVINAFRLEAQGGAATDYRIWAADAQGVETVYPYAKEGAPSEINLYIEATIADSIDGKGTPTQSIIDDVEQVVNFDPDTSLSQNERGRRPLQVIVNYLPVTIREVTITVTSYQGLTSDIEDDIESAFTDMLAAIRPFVAAADNLTDQNDILDNNKIIAAIITAKPGAVFGAVSFRVDGVAKSIYTFIDGDIPYRGTVTFN